MENTKDNGTPPDLLGIYRAECAAPVPKTKAELQKRYRERLMLKYGIMEAVFKQKGWYEKLCQDVTAELKQREQDYLTREQHRRQRERQRPRTSG